MLSLGFKEKNWENLLSTIDKEDIYIDEDGKKGLEHEPHVTVLYGLHKEVKDKQVSEILKDATCPEIEFTRVSVFDNENYDVLKFDVKSKELVELNKEFRELPYTNNFPDYQPHCTIGYFKKGKAKKYIDLIEIPKEIPCKEFVYSKVDGSKKTYEIKETKFEEGGNVKSENALEQIIELTQANRDEWIAEIQAKAIEKGEPLEKRDIQYLEWSLIADLMKAIGKYIKPTDKLIKVQFIDFNKVQIIATIERDGKEHSFSTDFIPAGGYNIQSFHYRYIVKTTLDAVSSNPFYDKFKEKLKSLTKLQRLDKDIERVNGLIERYNSDLAETNRRMSLSASDLEKEAREYDKNRGNDSWKMVDLTYEQLNDNYKAQGQILERTKEEFEANTQEYKEHKLNFYKYLEGKPTVIQNRIKELLKEKVKIEAKIQAETENLDKFEDGGNVNPKDSVNLDIPLMIRLLELAREDIKSDKELHDVAERLIDLRNKEVLTMEDYDFIAGVKDNPKYKAIEESPKYAKGANIEPLLAPNGKPSNLTPEQYKLVRTPEFKAWFGDWESDPKNASKVVDANGEPLVVYHGTKNKFYVFKESKQGSNTNHSGETGFFFSENKEVSLLPEYYANSGNLHECFLNLKNPKIIQGKRFTMNGNYSEYKRNLIEDSYDSVIILPFTLDEIEEWNHIFNDSPINEFRHNQYVAFEPNQIKLADGTNTTFDSTNPDIRFEDGGSVNNGLLAPNGEPSKLTPEQYKLVRTPEFKAWFGDWELNPKNASKVVNENGEPLVCYHGSDKIFTEFKNLKPTEGYKAQYWFTPSKEVAEMYPESEAKKVYECFINIKHPSPTYPIPEAKDYDGFIDFKTEMDYTTFTQKKEITIVQATESNQIKLADGTNTTFDSMNPDIRFENGGEITTKATLPSDLKSKETKIEEAKALLLKAFPYLTSLDYLGGGLYGFAFLTEIDHELFVVKLTNSITEYWASKMAFVSNAPNVVKFKDIKELEKEFTYGLIHEYVDRDGILNEYAWNYAVQKENFEKDKSFMENLKQVPEKEKEYVIKTAKKLSGEVESFFGCTMDILQQNWGYNSEHQLVLFDVDGNIKKNQYLEWMDKYETTNSETQFKDGGSVNTILLAPNGQPSNLTLEQYKLVRTPAFKAWFGDWESDPKNASKVVDANGEPLVVFHGSRSEFNVFDKSQAGKSNSIARIGFWFTPMESFARNFTDNTWYGNTKDTKVYSVFLSIKTPKIYTTDEVPKETIINLQAEIQALKEKVKDLSKKWVYEWEERQVFNYALQDVLNDKNIDYYRNKTPKSAEAIADGYEARKINNEISELQTKYYNLVYSDSYQKMSTDIYKFENKTAYDANVGGLGMMLDNVVKTTDKYVQSLKEQGFDGIIIEKTRFDQVHAGGLNDQFVVFEPEQIKLADGTNTTFDTTNPDIRFEEGGSVGATTERFRKYNEA